MDRLYGEVENQTHIRYDQRNVIGVVDMYAYALLCVEHIAAFRRKLRTHLLKRACHP